MCRVYQSFFHGVLSFLPPLATISHRWYFQTPNRALQLIRIDYMLLSQSRSRFTHPWSLALPPLCRCCLLVLPMFSDSHVWCRFVVWPRPPRLALLVCRCPPPHEYSPGVSQLLLPLLPNRPRVLMVFDGAPVAKIDHDLPS